MGKVYTKTIYRHFLSRKARERGELFLRIGGYADHFVPRDKSLRNSKKDLIRTPFHKGIERTSFQNRPVILAFHSPAAKESKF